MKESKNKITITVLISVCVIFMIICIKAYIRNEEQRIKNIYTEDLCTEIVDGITDKFDSYIYIKNINVSCSLTIYSKEQYNESTKNKFTVYMASPKITMDVSVSDILDNMSMEDRWNYANELSKSILIETKNIVKNSSNGDLTTKQYKGTYLYYDSLNTPLNITMNTSDHIYNITRIDTNLSSKLYVDSSYYNHDKVQREKEKEEFNKKSNHSHGSYETEKDSVGHMNHYSGKSTEDNYDEGYEDVWLDDDFDWDRYQNDPTYADGVDDAMDDLWDDW